ncbi:hypothetical protein PVAP13_2KG009100, partial [Panicum virgatum]
LRAMPRRRLTNEPPRIIRVAEDTILFSVIRPEFSPGKYEYFDAGLLVHGDDKEFFMVASLVSTDKVDLHELHRFDSRTGVWSQVVVRLVEPQISFPYRITRNSSRLGYHLTSTVITIGGEGGRMGWVDLWRGILICDVLDPEPELHGVPLPLPMDLLTCNNGLGTEIGGYANPIRGIAVDGQCLRFVHLEATISKTYNSKMTASWKDWILDCKARASQATIPSKVMSKMLNSRLLLSPDEEGANPVRALGNLWVSHPALGTDDGVVYLLARLKFEDPKAFMIALDTRENTLIGSAKFATERKGGDGITYFPSNISKYIDPEARILPISKGLEDNYVESIDNEGTESVEFPTEKIAFSGIEFGDDDDASVDS